MTIAIPVLDRCTKLNLFRAMRSVEMTPTASKVLQFIIDDRTAPMWCLRRFAVAVGRSPRSVDAAIAELKRLGFIDVIYRRRGAAIKVLRVDAILNAVSRAVAIARQTARAVQHTFLRAFQASQKSARYIHSLKRDSEENAEWRVQRPASAALLRSMGLPVPPGRR